MSEFPRTQKIAALVVITSVVVITLVAVALRGGSSTDASAPLVDPNATPTAVPILAQPTDEWPSIETSVRGVMGTTPPVDCPFLDERVRDPNNFLSLTPALTFVCPQGGLQARPIAPGRVVMRVSQPALNGFKADLLADGEGWPVDSRCGLRPVCCDRSRTAQWRQQHHHDLCRSRPRRPGAKDRPACRRDDTARFARCTHGRRPAGPGRSYL